LDVIPVGFSHLGMAALQLRRDIIFLSSRFVSGTARGLLAFRPPAIVTACLALGLLTIIVSEATGGVDSIAGICRGAGFRDAVVSMLVSASLWAHGLFLLGSLSVSRVWLGAMAELRAKAVCLVEPTITGTLSLVRKLFGVVRSLPLVFLMLSVCTRARVLGSLLARETIQAVVAK
jgi:hypothetical protein